MNTEATTTKNIGTNAKEVNKLDYSKGEQMFTNEPIKNTPFILKWVKDKGYSISITNRRITVDYATEEEALRKINRVRIDTDDIIEVTTNTMDWELMFNMMGAMMDIHMEYVQELKLKEEEK